MPDIARGTNELADALGPFWSAEEVRAVLNVSEGSLVAEQQAGNLSALRTRDAVTVYPTWQFVRRDDWRVQVRPGFRAMLRGLTEFDPWAVAALLKTPAPELGNLTPQDAAGRLADIEVLADLARTVAREWSAGTPRPLV